MSLTYQKDSQSPENRQYVSDINEVISDELESYLEDTRTSPLITEIEETLETGSVKITEQMARQAIIAVRTRIEATEDYTRKRLERINKNYKLYESREVLADAKNQVFIPEIHNAVEDWVDDLVLIYRKLLDSLDVDKRVESQKRILPKKQGMDPMEDLNIEKGLVRSAVYENQEMMQALNEHSESFGLLGLDQQIYYYNNLEAILNMLIQIAEDAKILEKLEGYFNQGVTSGLFCCKESWAKGESYKIVVNKDSDKTKDGELRQGKYKYTAEQEMKYCWEPIDTRRLIFRQDSFEWVIEIIDTNFWKIMNETVDEDGKPLKNAAYSYKQLLKIKDAHFNYKDVNDDDMMLTSNREYDQLLSENARIIDGDIRLLECHGIPLVMKSGEMPRECIVTLAVLDDGNNLVPIRIQQTPYVKPIYKFKTMFDKDGDVAGRGVPEVVELLQEMINFLVSFMQDLIDFATYGIIFGDPNHFEDPSQLENMGPKDFVRTKNTEGLPLESYFKHYIPNLTAIPIANEMLRFYIQYLKVTTRKGATGEKISPNPTATETNSIISERAKSVNRVAMRISDVFRDCFESMYAFSLMNRDKPFMLKLKAFRIVDSAKEGSGASAVMTEKWVEMTPEDLYVDGLAIKINSLDNAEKQAMQKQQEMQLFSMLGPWVQPIDPASGDTVTVMDSMGTPKQLDVYKLISSIGKSHGKNPQEMWKDAMQKQQQPTMPGGMPGIEPTQAPNPGQVPSSEAPAPPNLVNSTANPVDLTKSVANSAQIQI